MMAPPAIFSALTRSSVETVAASKDWTLGRGDEELLRDLSGKSGSEEFVALGAVLSILVQIP
jgi:hypothetical protein